MASNELNPAFLFDLDGTLVDSVYQHVLAWQDALDQLGIDLAVWRIHRKVGMSGGLFTNALLRETGRKVTDEDASRLRKLHAEAYNKRALQIRPLPGASELLAHLTELGVPWAIATSGYRESAAPVLDLLEIPAEVPVVTRDQVRRAKPDPDLFLAAAERLGINIADTVVVGDSVWDLLAARRARALGVGVLSGGYGTDEPRTGWCLPRLRRCSGPSGPPGRGWCAHRLTSAWRLVLRGRWQHTEKNPRDHSPGCHGGRGCQQHRRRPGRVRVSVPGAALGSSCGVLLSTSRTRTGGPG